VPGPRYVRGFHDDPRGWTARRQNRPVTQTGHTPARHDHRRHGHIHDLGGVVAPQTGTQTRQSRGVWFFHVGRGLWLPCRSAGLISPVGRHWILYGRGRGLLAAVSIRRLGEHSGSRALRPGPFSHDGGWSVGGIHWSGDGRSRQQSVLQPAGIRRLIRARRRRRDHRGHYLSILPADTGRD
jgi:hypothetical protein